MTDSWIVLLPPIFVLSCAALTHNVIISLILGIATASLIASNFALFGALGIAKDAFVAQATSANNVYLFSFLMILGFIIEMMTHSGSIRACTNLLRRSVKDKRGAETTSLVLSNFFFLDDYFNGLTVGAIMRPLTDTLSIPRAKLAFLINSMSAPACLLIPASTWMAVILVQLQVAGLSDIPTTNPIIFADPLYTFLHTIPFIFYAIFMVFSAWLIVRARISFGAMHQQELIAQNSGNLFGGKTPYQPHLDINGKTGSISGFFIPISIFMVTMLFFVFYTGNAAFLGGDHSILDALKKANTTLSLCIASVVSALSSTIYFLMRKHLTPSEIIKDAYHGFMLTRNSLIILFLAYAFGALLTDNLQAGTFLAKTIAGILPLFLLPVVLFIISTAITSGTGSSWSTIAIMTSITIEMLVALANHVTPMSIEQVPQFYASLGALLAGTAAGSHISPITDSTVMASTASGAYHMDHVQTQIAYSMPAIIGSCAAFIALGLLGNQTTFFAYAIAFAIGLSITAAILLYRNENRATTI